KWQFATKFSFEFGPAVGALIFSEEEDQLGIENDKPPFKKIDLSGNIGVSYPLTEHLTINTRFSNSIIPIRHFPSGFSFAFFDRGQYNTVLAFSLHYQF